MENTALKADFSDTAGGQYAGKTAAQRHQARHQQLIEAGIKLAGTGGQKAATVNAICAEAGLTKRYFYESFSSRDELISAAYAVVSNELKQQVRAALQATINTPSKMSEASLATLFHYIGDNPARGRFLILEVLSFNNVAISQAYDDNVRDFANILLEINSPLMPPTAPPKSMQQIATQGAIGAICYLAQRWIMTGYEQPVTELVEASQLLLNGLKQQFGIELT